MNYKQTDSLSSYDMRKLSDIVQYILVVGLFLAILAMMVGCKTVQPVVMPQTHTENKDSIRTEYKHDSIYIDRWHKEYIKGDTVFIYESIWRDRFRNIKVHDSVYCYVHDSVPYPVEVVKTETVEIDKYPFLRKSGIALWVIVALFVVGVIVGIILKIKK